jgi:hypothetical protein
MKKNQGFATLSELVRFILKTDKRCRNDDRLLTYKVFKRLCGKQGRNIFIPVKVIRKLPAFESVKRCRAKIQNNERKLLPTEKRARIQRYSRRGRR